MDYTSEEIIESLKDIFKLSGFSPVDVEEHNYWFLRTQGGEYFSEFYFNNYVAIDWNDVPCLEEKARTDELKSSLKSKYGQPTRVLNQVYRFCNEMKAGDIVIIPSTGSSDLAFGRITDDNFYNASISEEDLEDGKCPYIRRRSVEWLKCGKRALIDPKLFSFFRNQQALANANDYAEYIERAINPFYVKGDIAHLNIIVNKQTNLKATTIPYYMLGLNQMAIDLSNEFNIDIEEPEARINVQSPGTVEFFGSVKTIFLIAFVYIGLFGGEFKALSVSFKTDGVIKVIVDAYSKIKVTNHLISENKLKELQNQLEIDNPTNNSVKD